MADSPREPGSRPRPGSLQPAADVLAQVSTISAYFAVSTGPADRAGDVWRPLNVLFTDAGALSAGVADVQRRLGTTETRVAASILFQGLAARLWSPVVAAAVVHDTLIDLDALRVHPAFEEAGPLPLWAPHPVGWRITDLGQAAEPLYGGVMTALLEPLARAVRKITKIAPALLWGNAASALAGTLGAIVRHRPESAARAVVLGDELLSRGKLRGSGELAPHASGQLLFVRRSCCLYYRLPGGGKCGDCALLDPRASRER